MSGFDYARMISLIAVLLMVISIVMVPGLNAMLNIGQQIDVSQREDYRLAVLLENVQSLDATREELSNTPGTSGYDYDRRRAVIPVEFFVNEKSASEPGVGFGINNGHCYLHGVPRLDGQDFGFFITDFEGEPDRTEGSVKSIDSQCKQAENVASREYAPVLLVRKDNNNPPQMVRMYVYRIQEE